ncbi:MAG: TetR family transcriptional regulator [Mycobacterium sp.]|nr:TetR family transcriptional regulator [Mycobacterium sp.]
MTTTNPTPPTLRDRRRTELLTHIQTTAHQLFAQHGYAAVTTDDIAATAGISISTYYRHAPNKEHLLTAPIQQAIAEIITTYNTRPPTETAATSLIHLLVDHLGETAGQHSPHWKHALQSAPHLLNSSTLLSDNQTRQLTTMIATRMNTDPTTDIRPTLLIHTALSTAQTVLQHWLNNTTTNPPLRTQLQQALHITLAGFH